VARLVPALRRSVAVEAGLGVAVLAVTSVLVAQRPAREVYAPAFHDSVPAYLNTAEITVDPPLHGRETITLRFLDPDRKPVDVAEAQARLNLPARGLGPLTCTLRPAGEHVYSCPVVVPEPGEWELRLTVRVSDFDSYFTSSTFTVR
jgi:copper transport protein